FILGVLSPLRILAIHIFYVSRSSANDSATTAICTLSLHAALPIYRPCAVHRLGRLSRRQAVGPVARTAGASADPGRAQGPVARRSEEHTSELQSRENLVCRLLLEKKKEKIAV